VLVPTSQKTPRVRSKLMLCRETIAVYCESQTATACGQSAGGACSYVAQHVPERTVYTRKNPRVARRSPRGDVTLRLLEHKAGMLTTRP
jgi:hypothetical protein